ncbi:MAG: VOC family protein [Candidatus Nanopelagicales bacterium]
MPTLLTPYLSFLDNAREAMEFYASVLGGELTVTTFGEFQASQDLAEQDKVMHAMLVSPSGLTLMAADTPNGMDYVPGNNFSVSLSGEDEAELTRYWNALSQEATVIMPFGPAPWGGIFGMCEDRFGVRWMVNVNAAG